jgi:hypothetical protein
MVAAAVLAIGLLRVGATIPELILLLALLNGVAALRVRGVGADGHCGVPRRSRTDGGAILTPRAAAIL